MITEQKCWHSRVRLAKTRRKIYFLFRKGKLYVDLRSRSGHGWPDQYLDLGSSCCISLGSAAHSEHIGSFRDALAQFGQELLTKNGIRSDYPD